MHTIIRTIKMTC